MEMKNFDAGRIQVCLLSFSFAYNLWSTLFILETQKQVCYVGIDQCLSLFFVLFYYCIWLCVCSRHACVCVPFSMWTLYFDNVPPSWMNAFSLMIDAVCCCCFFFRDFFSSYKCMCAMHYPSDCNYRHEILCYSQTVSSTFCSCSQGQNKKWPSKLLSKRNVLHSLPTLNLHS